MTADKISKKEDSKNTINEDRINLITDIEIALAASKYEWTMTYDPDEDAYYFKVANVKIQND